MVVVVDIGLISQVLHRSEANFGESCQGQDVILISCLSLSTVWNSSKTLFTSAVCELWLWTKNLYYFASAKSALCWLYDFTHLRMVYMYPIQ